MCVAAHGWKSADGLSDSSNCYCLPAEPGGLLLTLVAKNALAEGEIRELNRVTDILLSVFEDQLDLGKLTMMEDAKRLLDQQLRQLARPVLRDGGSVSAEEAKAHVKRQYKLFDEQRRLARKAAADAELAALKAEAKKLPKARKRKG